MRSGSAPTWARALALAVCDEAGDVPPSVLRWRRAEREASTGLTDRRRRSIAVTAGRDEEDARHTLLHELAHWLAPEVRRRRGRRTIHHGAEFYAVAFALYARHEPDLERALRREASRYPTALRHAAERGLAGAKGLLAERGEQRSAAKRHHARWRVLVPEHRVALAREGRWYVCSICGRRLVGRTLIRAARHGQRERHTVWTRAADEASA